YVNRSCRGVEPAPGGDLSAAFQQQVNHVASPKEMERHEALAREVHAEFERKARRAGAWADVDAAAREALQDAALVALPSASRWQDALAPFAEEDVVARPFYLAPDLRWLTFRWDGHVMQVLRMEEDGSLHDEGDTFSLPPAPPPEGTLDVLRRLAGRDVFAG